MQLSECLMLKQYLFVALHVTLLLETPEQISNIYPGVTWS